MERVLDLLDEREQHLDALDGWLRDAVSGNGRIVFVGGEAGIGKSVLLDRFTQLAHGRARVLRGTCDMLSTPRPLGPMLDFAASIGGKFDRLLNSDESRDRIFRATLEELSQGLMPTIAIIEDAHWADEATLDLLRFLGRRIDEMRVLIVVTYRDDEVGLSHPLRVVLGDLATAKAIRHLKLEPLSAEGTRELMERCPDAPNVDPVALHQMTGGNPFFASEVLFSGSLNSGKIPTTVRDAVLARASRLSCAAIEALEAVAVIGSPIPVILLIESSTITSEAVEECLERGMLVTTLDGAISFRHELARTAIYDAIGTMRRRDLHAQVLAALKEHPTCSQNFALLAHHADASADREGVLHFGLEAARRAVCLKAHREAAAQYARVMRYWRDLPEEERADHLEDYSYELFLTGEIDQAIALRHEAIDIWRARGNRAREGNALRGISRLFWHAGKNAESIASADSAIAILESLPLGPELPKALSLRSQLYMLAGEHEQAIAWGNRALALAEEFGETGTSIHALINVGTARLSLEVDAARSTLEQGLALALEEDLDDHAARAFINLAWHAIHVRDCERAGRYLDRGIEYAAGRDLESLRHYMIACRSHMYLLLGRWTDAVNDAESVLEQPHAAPISRIPALMVRGLVAARRGDAGAMELLTEALQLALKTGEIQRLRPVRLALAEAAWLSGDLDCAAAEVEAIQELTLERGTSWDIGELAAWLRRSSPAVSTNTSVAGWPLAEPYRLAVDGDWAAAADTWRNLGCPYEQALALLEGDECALRDALALFQQLGARATEAIAARRLRQLGARGIPRGPRPATRSNPANLTAREFEVLPFLAEGRQNIEIANRLFLSAKTVEHHVGNIFSKLGVHARGEVSGAVARLGIELTMSQDRAAD